MALAAILVADALGQTAKTSPAFEAADVHVSAATATPYARGAVLRGDRYEVRDATMLDLILIAYSDGEKYLGKPSWLVGERSELVSGGPDWLDADRFDVIAKAPPSSQPAALKAMLRTLLAERFGLAVHADLKSVRENVLTAGPHPRLKAADGSGDSGCQFHRGSADPDAAPYSSISCRNTGMAALADELRRDYFETPLKDMTGLQGAWNFDLKWTPRGQPASSGVISIFDAVDKQLGLKIEPRDIATAVTVIDHVNRKPADNPSGVTQALSTVPAKFEVAVVKLSPADEPSRGFQLQPGNRLTVQGVPLKNMILIAWDLDADMLAEAPKWMDTERIDILAKAPAPDGAEAGAGTPMLGFDDIRPMLQALLIDRFSLATHNESRSVPVYALVAAKGSPKIAKTQYASEAGDCRSAPPVTGSAAKSPLTAVWACRNVTMSMLAQKLHGMAPNYIGHLVVDGTGIGGAWDFMVSWTPWHDMAGFGRPAAQGPAETDPSGGMGLFEAFEKELGLKLELQKRAMQVLVIDHAEPTPSDN
jgi:uncharacterized protein (TIGR03435 family)